MIGKNHGLHIAYKSANCMLACAILFALHWMAMKCWKVAALDKSQALRRRRLAQVHALFLGMLACLLCGAALANQAQVVPAHRVHELRTVKGSPATPNSTLISPYRVLNSIDGLPQNTVRAMASGPDGRIYVGTYDGLSRFDGGIFTRLPLHQPDLPALVTAITAVDAQIWVGTDETGLWLGDGEYWQQVALVVPKIGNSANVGPGPGPGTGTETETETGTGTGTGTGSSKSTLPGIAAIRNRSSGGVWVSTTAGLFNCVETACVYQRSTAGWAVREVLEGQYHGQAVLWIAAQDQGLVAFALAKDGKLGAVQAQFGEAEGLGSASVRTLASWQGALWIGTRRGLSRLRQNASAPDEMTFWGRDDSPFAAGVSVFLTSLDAQKKPILLVATLGGGLIQIDEKDQWSALTVAQGLPENQLTSLLQLPGGGPIWIGTASSGIARADPGGWVAYTERHGLPHRSVIGMGKARFPDDFESYWLGTISGAVRLENGRWRSFLPASIASRPIYDIAPRKGGGLWLASDVGVFSWDGKALNKFSPDNANLPGFIVLDIQRHGKTGALWLALPSGLATIVDDKISTVKGSAGAFNLRYVDALAGGSMFAAGNQGLAWFKGDGSVEWIKPPCLAHPSTYSMALAATKAGEPVELWVGGRGGITRLRFEGAGAMSKIECNQVDAAALGSIWVYEVKFDASGDLYAFGYNGAKRLHVAELNALDHKADAASTRKNGLESLEIERFGLVDGLPDLEFNRGVMLDHDGRIWASNVAGAVIFDPKTPAKPLANARLIFTSLRAAKGTNSADKIVPGEVLPNGTELRAGYRLLSYSRESKIRYRTQLLGLELQPSDWTSDAARNFARLPGGQYVFKVWAKDALDRPYGPIEVAFSVALPLWLNPWLIFVVATALIYAGTVLGRLRSDALKRKALKRAQTLESQVRSRTQELADANVQLEKLALTDPLTGCYNRRCFYERYLHAPQRKDLLIILLDIDYFKKINDEFGHAGGDAVLVQFALRLQQSGAPVFRMGGEEFMILAVAGSVLDQQALIETILKQISAQAFDLATQKLNVTTSIGAACFLHQPIKDSKQLLSAEQANRFEHAIQCADAALYQAKQAGRNRAVLAEQSEMAPEADKISAESGLRSGDGRGKFRE